MNNNESNFDLLNINLRRPLQAVAIGLFWSCAGVPLVVGVVWGVYNQDNIASVLGVSARRAAGSAITETQPVGVKLLKGVSGETDRIEAPNGCINLADPNEPCTARSNRR